MPLYDYKCENGHVFEEVSELDVRPGSHVWRLRHFSDPHVVDPNGAIQRIWFLHHRLCRNGSASRSKTESNGESSDSGSKTKEKSKSKSSSSDSSD